MLKKEINGYIGNRLQKAYVDEARRLVEEGYCTYQDVDEVIVNGFGVRMAFMGLSQYYNLGGGLGGIEHCFKLFGWKGTREAQEDLRATVQKFAQASRWKNLKNGETRTSFVSLRHAALNLKRKHGRPALDNCLRRHTNNGITIQWNKMSIDVSITCAVRVTYPRRITRLFRRSRRQLPKQVSRRPSMVRDPNTGVGTHNVDLYGE
nr:3-hydroxyacyl-CoA dehydrogenase family protein [Phyllobacterium sp. KW56]